MSISGEITQGVSMGAACDFCRSSRWKTQLTLPTLTFHRCTWDIYKCKVPGQHCRELFLSKKLGFIKVEIHQEKYVHSQLSEWKLPIQSSNRFEMISLFLDIIPTWLFILPGKLTFPPENQWLQDAFPIAIVPFLGDMLVFWGVVFS